MILIVTSFTIDQTRQSELPVTTKLSSKLASCIILCQNDKR